MLIEWCFGCHVIVEFELWSDIVVPDGCSRMVEPECKGAVAMYAYVNVSINTILLIFL